MFVYKFYFLINEVLYKVILLKSSSINLIIVAGFDISPILPAKKYFTVNT